MKKISAVLLVLVLVGSVVFAGFTGSATTTLGYDLDNSLYGFTNASAIDIDVVLHEFPGAAKGEGDIYAEITASVKLMFDSVTVQDGDLLAGDFDVYAKVTAAKIVSKNWTLGILSALDAPNLATSSVFMDANDEYADLKATRYIPKVAGINLTTKGYTMSFGLKQNTAPAYDVYASLLAPAFEAADGLKLTVGGSGSLSSTNGTEVSGSVKADYASEGYSAKLAADVIYSTVSGLDADVAISSKFAPVTVDVYFATEEVYATAGASGVTNALSAKVGVALDQVTLTVTGKDLLNTQALSVSAKLAASKALAVTARGGYTLVGGAWNAGADVVYTAADYTATLNTTYASAGTLALTVKAVSTTLVNKATLTAQYTVADILTAKGALTASAKIAF
jgi:hypothetical protein